MELPVFRGSEGERLTKIIDWLLKNIKLRRWSEEKFSRNFFSRSPEQIIREGESCYRLPCSDLASVASELMLANGFKPTVVFERLTMREKKAEQVGVHMTVEFLLNGKPVHLRITRAEIKIVPGFMNNGKTREIIGRHNLEKPHLGTPYFHLFGVHDLKELKAAAKADYLGLFEGKFHRINSRPSRFGAMLRRARFRVVRAAKKPFKRRKGI